MNHYPRTMLRFASAIAAAIVAAGSVGEAQAQYSFTSGALTVTENFVGWGGGANPTNWTLMQFDNNGANQGPTFKNATGLVNTTGGNGFSSVGSVGGTNDRSVVLLGAGGRQNGMMMTSFTNNTGGTMTALSIDYTAHQWYLGTTRNSSLTLQYSTNGTAWTSTASVYNAPRTNGGTNVAINGLGSGNFQTFTGVNITGLSVANGSTFFVRWYYEGGQTGTGSRQALGISDLSFTATAEGGGGAKDLTWNVAGSGTWNTSASNWTTGSGSTTFANADTVTFNNSAGGTITVDAGGVEPATTTISAASGTYTFSGGAIGGAGSLVKSGNGTAILSADNTYGGATTINGGVLQAASNAALGNAAGGITLGGGTLQAGGTISGSRSVTVNAGGGTIDTNGNSVGVGGISGAGSFTKAGAGTLTATGFSAGGLNVSSGTMRIDATAATQLQAGTIAGVLELGGAQRFNLGTGTLGGAGTIRVLTSLAGLNTTGSGIAAVLGSNIELNPSNTEGFVFLLHPTGGNTIAVNGVISGSGTVQFSVGTNGGAGITTLNAQNTYTGATFLNMASSGVLRMGTANALPSGSVVTLGASYDGLGTQDRGTIDLAGHNLTVGGLASVAHASTRGIGNTSGTLATLTVNQASDTTFHAQIGSGFATTTNMEGATTNIALVKTGVGKLTLTSTSSNFTGGTTVSAGTLSISADENLGGSSGGITLGGGTLEMTSGFTLGSGRTITAAASTTSTLAVTTGTVSYGGAFTGSGNLDKAGAGRLVVSNASSGYSGLFTVSAGTLEVTGPGAFANATLSQTGGTLLLAPSGGGDVFIPDLGGSGGTTEIAAGATARVGGPGNSSYNGRVRGGGGLQKDGAGELTLNGNNDFAGNTRIAAGKLKLGAGGALSATPQIEIDSGAIFDVTAKSSGFALGNGQRLGGRGTVLGDLEFGSGSKLGFDSSGPLLVGSGTVSFAAGFGIADIIGLDANTADGTYTLLDETVGGTISLANLVNVGFNNRFTFPGQSVKQAYFQQGSLQVVVVPEPSSLALAGLGVAIAWLGAWRRRAGQASRAA